MKTLFILISMLTIIGSARAGTQYVIVNKSNPIERLSKAELRNIYLGNTSTWSNNYNYKIQIVDYNSESSLREEFTRNILNLSPNKVSMIWLKVTLSGKVSPPKIYFKTQDILKFISENIDAIGYVESDKDIPPDVKIVQVY